MAQSAKDKITKAGLRPTVSFYDFHYFPTQDIMISSNGDVYRRQPQAAADAFLKTKSD
jgi:hypothetical protein